MINIIFIVVDGLGTGIVTLIGQNLGANLLFRVKDIAQKSLWTITLITLFEAAFVFLLRTPLFNLFIPNRADIISEGIHFLTIFSLGIPFFGLIAVMFLRNKSLIYRVYKNPATREPNPKPRFNPRYIKENISLRFSGVLKSTIMAS